MSKKSKGHIKVSLEDLDNFLAGTTEGWQEGTYEERREILEKLPLGGIVAVERMSASETNVTRFNTLIRGLQKVGLDIGKGDAEYGYKMPLPKSEENYRELIIFRRR